MKWPASKLIALAACVLVALMALAPAAGAKRRSTFGLFGTVADAALLNTPFDAQQAQARLMVRSGVESVRIPFDWSLAQPYESFGQIPPAQAGDYVAGPNGVPTNFSVTDRYVRLASQRRMLLLPVVLFAPRWASLNPNSMNAALYPRASDYGNYLEALVERYGPHGSFWDENPTVPRRPVREYQIWNEPQLTFFWRLEPYREKYPAFMRVAHREIKAADPGAKVVLGGQTNSSWRDLTEYYRHGLKGTYDVIALHPYTASVARVLTIVRLNRRVMRRNGDARKPVYLTELAWSAAAGKIPKKGYIGIEVSQGGQASRLRRAYKEFVKQRGLRIRRAYWYAWASTYTNGPPDYAILTFRYSGLMKATGAVFRPTTALNAYQATARKFEGCAKTDLATVCQ